MHAKAAVRDPEVSTGASRGVQVIIFEEGSQNIFETLVEGGGAGGGDSAGTGKEGGVTPYPCPQQCWADRPPSLRAANLS